MRRALVLIAWVAAVLGAAGAVAAQESFKTPDEVLQYLVKHRDDVALVSYTARPDGSPDPADPVIFRNADVPMPLASTIKVVVLAAYAREVVAGRLDPHEGVALADWERFYLPKTDGGAHPNALAALGIPADDLGFARDSATVVPLDAVARAMIRRSDNAATDYLLERLGRAALRETIAEAGLTGQDLPLPLLGLFLSWDNHQEGSLTPRKLQVLQNLPDDRYVARVDHFVAAYQDEAWRRDQIAWLTGGRVRYRYPLEVQAAVTLFPGGTARDYARILAGVVTGTFLSPEISAVMRPHLERDLLGATDFDSIGFKGGTLSGVLTEAAWLVPREGDFAGKPRIVVLFLRGLPLYPWAALMRDTGQVVFAFGMARDRSFALRTERVLAPRRS
jgi:hypothetical protein